MIDDVPHPSLYDPSLNDISVTTMIPWEVYTLLSLSIWVRRLHVAVFGFNFPPPVGIGIPVVIDVPVTFPVCSDFEGTLLIGGYE